MTSVVVSVTGVASRDGRTALAVAFAGQVVRSSGAAGLPLRVVVVDAGNADGQLASVAGVYAPSLADLPSSPDQAGVLACLHRIKGLGVDVLVAPPAALAHVREDAVEIAVEALRGTHDVVVVATGPLAAHRDNQVILAADRVLVVAAASEAGMLRLDAEFRRMADDGTGPALATTGVILNGWRKPDGVETAKTEVERGTGLPVVAVVPASRTCWPRLEALLDDPALASALHQAVVWALPSVPLVLPVPDLVVRPRSPFGRFLAAARRRTSSRLTKDWPASGQPLFSAGMISRIGKR